MRKQAHKRPDELKPGDKAVYIAGIGRPPGRAVPRHDGWPTLLRQVFLPTSMREQAIKEVHERAHAGSKGTCKALWYFNNMQTAVDDYVRACLPCMQSKTRRGRWHYVPEPQDQRAVRDHVGGRPRAERAEPRLPVMLVVQDM
jgi:hypothetical protein